MINRKKEYSHLVTNLDYVPKTSVNKEKEFVKQSPYRQRFHIESPYGMLGDPNGFSYFNGYYHLFHQWFPMKYSKDSNYFQQGWYHWVSEDLINWRPLGEAMANDTKNDKYGVYSGSAIEVNKKLFLMYNGNSWINTKSNNWIRKPSQLGAWMDENNKITKLKTPLIKGPIIGYTEHFRDPKIFRKNKNYYAVIGAQTKKLTGTILIYRSNNLLKWNKLGQLNTNFRKEGYMWECPDYFEIKDRGILLFCPQGIKSRNNSFLNAFQVCYAVGSPIDFSSLEFDSSNFKELDSGFDFYAPQTMLTFDGRRILSAWACIMNGNSPTIKYHYDGCLIFPRELKIVKDKLIQEPIKEIKNLYTSTIKKKCIISKTKEIYAGKQNSRDLKFEISMKDNSQVILDIFADRSNRSHLRLIANAMKSNFIVNRNIINENFEEEFGSERTCTLKEKNKIDIRIIQDISSAEVFINNGENVFTMRIFVPKDQFHIFITSKKDFVNVKYSINLIEKMKN